MRAASFRLVRLLAALAVITYQSWLAAAFLNPALPTSNSFASELASTSQPHHWVFRSADVLTGMLILCVSFLLSRNQPTPLRAWPRWVRRFFFIAAALFASATILDAAFPMPCADSLTAPEVVASATCQTFSLRMHEFASVTVGIATVSICALSIWLFSGRWRAYFSPEDVPSRALSRPAFHSLPAVSVCVLALLHIGASLATVSADFFDWPPGLGWFQRTSILAVSLWCWTVVMALTTRVPYRFDTESDEGECASWWHVD